jgi:RNA polymerase sigma factor (sigma-70 family)
MGGLTDGQLLERFASQGRRASELAFGALVERHGPMVLRVCRQILGDSHEVQDAFQATFLILVRQARSIRKQESAASWLYGVAHRVAKRTRVNGARRRWHEQRRATTARESDNAPRDAWPELHDEIARLPEKYRQPVVLCYLEGLTTEAAAQWLGCPQGTILSRLSRGRDCLRARLTRRGLAPTVGTLLTASALEVAPVPPALLESTILIATRFAAGKSATGPSAVAAEALAKGVMWSMSLTKLKAMAAGALALGVLVGGTVAVARQEGKDESSRTPPTSQKTAVRVNEAQPPTSKTTSEAPTTSETTGAQTVEQLLAEKVDVEMLEMDLEAKKDQLQRAMTNLEELDARRASEPGLSREVEKALGESLRSAKLRTQELREDIHRSAVNLAQKRRELDLIAKPGDYVLVELLEALPGRPLTGTRIVGPTGVIILGWYGELEVAGLTNRQIKAKFVEHMRKYIDEEVLGLVEKDEMTGKQVRVDPADSNRAYVEIELGRSGAGQDGRMTVLEQRLNRVQAELDRLKRDR